MSTLGIMKARIADELARADLASQIAYAIGDAIEAYEDERFHFNESRALTFTTTPSQEFYDRNDAASLASILVIDYVMVYVGSIPSKLKAERPADIELMSQNSTTTGTPISYCWYGNQLRLYPTPNIPQTIRIGAAVKAPAPVSDVEANNPWMTHAARLIRSRAKLELALHVLKDADLAQTMNAATEEAFDQLKDRTNQLTQTESGRVEAMEF